jgi:membrane protease YdiL (CAAX protease family)
VRENGVDERASARAPATASLRRALFVLSLLTWFACFFLLRQLGTWLQFAVAGPALAAAALALDAETRALLRASYRDVAVGIGAGVTMVALTHAAFFIVSSWVPDVRASTAWLLRFVDVSGFPPALRTGLIVVIASSEEVIFRGAQLGVTRRRSFASRDALRIIGLSAAYAASMISLGSALLVACAFACGCIWAALRVATRSLATPIVAHVLWDLGVLIVWPLIASRGSS